jgi:hypothetical protein
LRCSEDEASAGEEREQDLFSRHVAGQFFLYEHERRPCQLIRRNGTRGSDYRYEFFFTFTGDVSELASGALGLALTGCHVVDSIGSAEKDRRAELVMSARISIWHNGCKEAKSRLTVSSFRYWQVPSKSLYTSQYAFSFLS